MTSAFLFTLNQHACSILQEWKNVGPSMRASQCGRRNLPVIKIINLILQTIMVWIWFVPPGLIVWTLGAQAAVICRVCEALGIWCLLVRYKLLRQTCDDCDPVGPCLCLLVGCCCLASYLMLLQTCAELPLLLCLSHHEGLKYPEKLIPK